VFSSRKVLLPGTLYAFLVSPIRAASPYHLSLIDTTILITFDEKHQL
jgi:hypothetical protein